MSRRQFQNSEAFNWNDFPEKASQPMSRRQSWAIFKATGIDLRETDLTKKAASGYLGKLITSDGPTADDAVKMAVRKELLKLDGMIDRKKAKSTKKSTAKPKQAKVSEQDALIAELQAQLVEKVLAGEDAEALKKESSNGSGNGKPKKAKSTAKSKKTTKVTRAKKTAPKPEPKPEPKAEDSRIDKLEKEIGGLTDDMDTLNSKLDAILAALGK